MGRRSNIPCRFCVAFLLKFMAFLQAFAAVSAVVYAGWVFSRWARRAGPIDLDQLFPDLWFVCALMGAGVFYCLVLLVGYIAAEMSSEFCLCFYTLLAIMMMLLEAAVAADLLFNKHWIQDLPYDRTGEMNNLLAFIQNNMDICKWVAVGIISTQALSLFLSIILRAMISARRVDYDSDEDFVVIRRPLLVGQGARAYLPGSVEGRGFQSDIWSLRMRQKYGLNPSEYSNTLGSNAPAPQ